MYPSPLLIVLSFILSFVSTAIDAAEPKESCIFNGRELSGWSGNTGHWKVDHGQLVGATDKRLDANVFLWSDVPVKDFYLSVWVKLTPDDRNSGIQFRSSKVPPTEARGYQADIGKTFWGRLYHESGRGKLVWSDIGEKAVKPGEWNHCEILAVGHRIWTAINGKLAVAVDDPQGELEGQVALQIHSGPPQEVRFKDFTLIHNPKIKLAGLSEKELVSHLRPPDPATKNVK